MLRPLFLRNCQYWSKTDRYKPSRRRQYQPLRDIRQQQMLLFTCFYCIATRCCRPSSSSITLDFTEDTLGAKMVFICPEFRASAPALKSSSCHRRTPPLHSADTTLALALLQLPASHAPLLSTSLPLVMSECLNLWKRKHAFAMTRKASAGTCKLKNQKVSVFIFWQCWEDYFAKVIGYSYKLPYWECNSISSNYFKYVFKVM